MAPLMGRKLHSRLDLLKPGIEQRIQDKQSRQQCDHDKYAKARTFVEGERVFVKNHRPSGEKLLSGEIVKSTGPVSFTVRMSDGTTIRSHQDHLRKRATVTEEQTDPPAGEEVETGT